LTACDGSEAWRLYEANRIDAVISDRSMPNMDGLELCRRIRERPGQSYTYFIFLTSAGEKALMIDGMQAGADDYLLKPLDPDELLPRLSVASRITELHRKLADQQSELEMLNQKLFEQARIDPLTQLGTRLRLSEDLALAAARLERYTDGYCALMCDVDHFKLYNDRYGHLAGDEVLKSVARALANGCRAGDQAYRYGGEEFLLILPNESLAGGQLSAERHRRSVEALSIPHPGSTLGFVTISIGVASVSGGSGRSVSAWLQDADAALYRSKRLGRNRVSAELDGARLGSPTGELMT
jgi:two-component system chemotaxis response regulator CheY